MDHKETDSETTKKTTHNHNITDKLKQWFEAWFETWKENHIYEQNMSCDVLLCDDGYWPRIKHFWIQYSCFERLDDGDWYMNCIVDQTQNQGVYDLAYDAHIKYSDETKIEFESRKNSYESFVLEQQMHGKGKSTDETIYLIDLYPEYEPAHFEGSCLTRGAFTGWNTLVWDGTSQTFTTSICSR